MAAAADPRGVPGAAARVRGRGISGAHGSALVHQLRLAGAGAGRRRRIGRELMPGLRLIMASHLSGATAQTSGMIRAAAISGDLVGARSLWMGRPVLPAGLS